MAARPDTPVASFVGSRPDLDRVRRVLLVRLRSIGDTVLMTPCITAIKSWREDVEVDVLLEPFCAPVLRSHPGVSRVIEVGRTAGERFGAARELRRRGYDLAVNLSGGSTGAMLALASGARWRVGFSGYRMPWLANTRVTSSHHVWKRTDVHTVEHQLALVAGIGVPVPEAGPTSLRVSAEAAEAAEKRLSEAGLAPGEYAVFHPEASFENKRWPADRFAALARTVAAAYDLRAVVVGQVPEIVREAAGDVGVAMPGVPLEETMALVERSALFVGNDSGPAHVAAAFGRPVVVIFGPSNAELWRPWSRAPWRVLRGETASHVEAKDVERAVEEVMEGNRA